MNMEIMDSFNKMKGSLWFQFLFIFCCIFIIFVILTHPYFLSLNTTREGGIFRKLVPKFVWKLIDYYNYTIVPTVNEIICDIRLLFRFSCYQLYIFDIIVYILLCIGHVLYYPFAYLIKASCSEILQDLESAFWGAIYYAWTDIFLCALYIVDDYQSKRITGRRMLYTREEWRRCYACKPFLRKIRLNI
jgi:hypothetical protein